MLQATKRTRDERREVPRRPSRPPIERAPSARSLETALAHLARQSGQTDVRYNGRTYRFEQTDDGTVVCVKAFKGDGMRLVTYQVPPRAVEIAKARFAV